ncbi:MAG TPA: ATP-binding protein [Chthoniobacteraceae bacterium]|nr:ATP-binding protein [Chthoniobacteraceae bacterium]
MAAHTLPDQAIGSRAQQLFEEHRKSIFVRTDRLFLWLMPLQWLVGVAFALWVSPRAWSGPASTVHPHVWAALFLGGVITFWPVFCAIKWPGALMTRHMIAIGQMLMSALLIHLTGGRIETHFHVFGSLAFLAFYRDWRVLMSASAVVAIDHFVRGIYFPLSVFGVLTASPYRWVEHAGWVAFEDIFLVIAIRQSLAEMLGIAVRQANLESVNVQIERKVAERTVELTKEILAREKTEQKFKGLLEFAPDAIIIINASGEIVLVNSQVEKVFGWRRGELIGKKVEILIPERFRDKHCIHRGGYFASPIARPMGAGLELYGLHSNGMEFPLEISLSPIETGDETLAIGAIRDITERKRTEAKLAEQAAELKRSNLELEQFAYVASHDMREPLRAVSGCAQILKNNCQGKLDGNADAMIGHIVDGAKRMADIIDDLLALSSIGSKGKPFEKTEIEKPLALALKNLSVAIRERGAAIHHDALPTLPVDASQIALLFQNLIGNAIKFCDGRAPEIRVGAAKDANGSWTISVRDNGIGIEPKYFERIFGIFQRLHTRSEYPGTGIGLAICKKIVERHGGRIWPESSPGEGTVFYFTLPETQKNHG